MQGLILRDAELLDIPYLVNLLKQLFSIETDFIIDIEKHKKGLQLLIEHKNTAKVLVAELEGKVIGMLSAQIFISTAEGDISIILEDMIIDELHRGKGIGKILLIKMENWAKENKIRRMQLLADISNKPALNFYKCLGWNSTNMFCLRKYTY